MNGSFAEKVLKYTKIHIQATLRSYIFSVILRAEDWIQTKGPGPQPCRMKCGTFQQWETMAIRKGTDTLYVQSPSYIVNPKRQQTNKM